MATERKEPDVLISSSNVTGAVGDIQADPDTKTGSWTAADPIRATGNNVDTEIYCSFPSPTGNLTVGADLQEFRVLLRPYDSGQTGDPNWRIELWENGGLVRAGSNTQILNDAGDTVVSFTWNANELSAQSGANVEIKVFGVRTAGGPAVRNTVDFGAVEWNVDYSTSTTTEKTLSETIDLSEINESERLRNRGLTDNTDVNSTPITTSYVIQKVKYVSTSDVVDSVVDAVINRIRVLLDPVDINDAIVSSIKGDIERTLSENVDITDSVIATTAGNIIKTLSDSLDISDSVIASTTGNIIKILTDSFDVTATPITTSYVIQKAKYLSTTDISDSILDAVLIRARSLLDSVDSVDSITRYLQANRNLLDNPDVVDAIDASVISTGSVVRTLSDNFDVNDFMIDGVISIRRILSALTVQDNPFQNIYTVSHVKYLSTSDLSDSIELAAANIIERSLSENFDVNDSVTASTTGNIVRTLADSFDLNDSTDINRFADRVLSEALIDTIDAISSTKVVGGAERVLTDNITVQDALSRFVQAQKTVLTDTLDVQSPGIQNAYTVNHSVGSSDNIDVNDALQSSAGITYRTLIDNLDITELGFPYSFTIHLVQLLDELELLDDLQFDSGNVTPRSLRDNINILDSQDSIASGIIRKILSDNIDINEIKKTIHSKTRKLTTDIIDNLSRAVGTVIDRDLLDSLLINDSQYRAFTYTKQLLDDIELADSVVGQITAVGSVNRILDENISINDSLVKDSNKDRELLDNAEFAETIKRNIVRSRPLSDAPDVTDNIERSLILASGDRDRELTDSISATDSMVRSLLTTGSKTKILSEQIVIVDDVVRLLQAERLLSDELSINEGITDNVVTFLQQRPDIFMDIDDRVPTGNNYNNLLYSQELSNRWQLTGGLISDSINDPFGDTDANRATATSGGALEFKYFNSDNYVRALSTSLTFSIFAKYGNIAKFPLVIRNRTSNSTLAILKYNWSSELFDIITGDESANASSHRVTFDNGFIRLGLTVTSGISINDIIELRAGFADATYSINDYFDVFGAQLDTGENMMPYQKTLDITLSTMSNDATGIVIDIVDKLNIQNTIEDNLNIDFKVA